MGLISDIKSLAHEPYNYARRHTHLRKKQFDPYRKAADFTGIPQMASDAYWSATHPIDRIRGRGRASGDLVMVGGHPMRMQVGMVQPSGGMFSGLSSGAKMKIFNIRNHFKGPESGAWHFDIPSDEWYQKNYSVNWREAKDQHQYIMEKRKPFKNADEYNAAQDQKITDMRAKNHGRTPAEWKDYVAKRGMAEYMRGNVIDDMSLDDRLGDPTGIAAFTDELPHGGRISRVIPPHLKAPKHVQEMLDKGELAYADEAPKTMSEMDKVLQDAEDSYWANRGAIDLSGKHPHGPDQQIEGPLYPDGPPELQIGRGSGIDPKDFAHRGPKDTMWPTKKAAEGAWKHYLTTREPWRVGTKTFSPRGLPAKFLPQNIKMNQMTHDIDLSEYIRQEGAPHTQWARKVKLEGSPMQRAYRKMEGKGIREDAMQRDQNFWDANPHWGPDLDAEPGDFDFNWASRQHEEDIQANMHRLADHLDPATRYDEGARVARNQSRRYGKSEGMFGVHYEEGTNWWRHQHGDHSVNPDSPIGKAIDRRLKKDPRWQGQHRQAIQENAIRRMPMAFGKKYEYALRDTAVPKRLAKKEILKRRWISGQRGG